MYPVSANFHTLAIQDAPKTRVRVYFIGDAVDCTDDNAVQTNGTLLIGKAGDTDSNGRIGQNGITFSDFFNPDKNIQVGAAVSSQIGMTLLNTDGALDNFQYGRCKVYLDVYDTANSSWLTCPMGVYIIDLPTKRKVQLINATGYDQMQKLDEICDTWWSALNWSGGITLSQLLTSLATQIGVSVSSNTASAIVNGSASFTEEPFQCVEVTYREVLEYIAEATGTVARFDRNGALDLRWFEQAGEVETNTYTGNPVSFVGTSNTSVSSAVAPITPIQNLNGYDNPWPAGGGVSKCPSFANGTYTTTNGLTVTIQDGEITINGTASAAGYYQQSIEETVMPADAYVSFNNPVGTYNIAYVFINGNTQIAAPSTAPANATKKPTGLSGATVNKLRIFCNAGTYDNFKMSPIVHDGSTPQAWQPYANICPITGRTGANVYVSPTQDVADATTYPVTWQTEAGTVYGGTVDVVSGILKAKPYIASYNGETLVGPWVSSMDGYTPGGTPTNGAQVVDMGGAETSYQLTSQQITALVGQNYVWSSVGGAITVGTATINPITIDTDTVGNQCLAISVAEYSVAAVDLLKIKLYTDDIGTTVGTGTNQYTIVNNLFLDGANSAAIIAKATPIYNRLHGLGAYSPVSARIITDWSIEAGDIINIVNDSTTYSVPIFQQSMAWRGGYVVSDLLSDGDNVRPVLDYDERTYYRLNSEMSKKVGDDEIISKINQSPESITIQANKVNLTGYVTFTNLSTPGQTVIDGGNITSNSISVSQFTSTAQGALAANATTKMQYYLSTSSSSATGGSWSDTVPTWASGKYVWTREATTITLASGGTTTNYSTEVYDKNLTTALSTATSASSAAAAAQSTADSANSQEQLIYISRPSGGSAPGATTSWITNTTGAQNAFTLKRPEYNSSYPVLYIATQRKAVDGTVTCTTPMIDLTTTVIDGGHITTGTIDASVVSVTNLNASNITSGSLSANYIQGGIMTVGGLNNTNGFIRILDSTGNYAGGIGYTGMSIMGEEPLSGLQHVLSNAFLPWQYSIYDQTTQKQLANIDSTVVNATDEYSRILLYGYDNGTKVSSAELNAYPYSGGLDHGAYLQLNGPDGLVRLNSDGTYAGNLTLTTGNLTVGSISGYGSTLDVVNRRCSADLSVAGWYRVLSISNFNPTYAGLVIKFCINQYSSSSENHQITLSITSSGSKFIAETSNGTNYVSDIRLMKVTNQNDKYYVDIKYDATTSKTVDVYFDVYLYNEYRGDIIPYGLANVGPSPANETEVAKYTFLTSCVCGMFTDTRTVTTDSTGYYQFSDYARSDYAIISIVPTSPTDSYALPTGTSTQWIRVWGSNGSALANTSVTLKTVFLKL